MNIKPETIITWEFFSIDFKNVFEYTGLKIYNEKFKFYSPIHFIQMVKLSRILINIQYCDIVYFIYTLYVVFLFIFYILTYCRFLPIYKQLNLSINLFFHTMCYRIFWMVEYYTRITSVTTPKSKFSVLINVALPIKWLYILTFPSGSRSCCVLLLLNVYLFLPVLRGNLWDWKNGLSVKEEIRSSLLQTTLKSS